MAQDDAPPKPRIPRPPSQADIDLVSSQQGMVSDEWAEAPAPKPPSPPQTATEAEAETEEQPS
ncbi:hypothetical protein JMJ56_12505 [Belnapia sp. T18]|uniref:Uncharacterized protein n=1 Tax=Belnapia arida TaxID=2804533 RepID=A0ABS1U542_9PROT|nr:hypothetical protein [Belnapia arida]MBL6078832.1 hypothetical protein [Belnapia arida]